MGKNANNTKPVLYFFDFPGEALDRQGVASALQSFESAIMLIANNRWPSVIPLLWNACEALLKEKYHGRESTAFDLQMRFEKEKKLAYSAVRLD